MVRTLEVSTQTRSATEESLEELKRNVDEEKAGAPYKMYVWRLQPDWIAVAHATSAESARVQILNEAGPADKSTPIRTAAMNTIRERNPEIFYRENAEFELTSSASLEEVDLYVETLTARIHELEKEVVKTRADVEDADGVRERLSEILKATANALHGGSLKHGLWSWHDLHVIAEEQRSLLHTALHALRSYQYGNASTELAEEIADACEKALSAGQKDLVEKTR